MKRRAGTVFALVAILAACSSPFGPKKSSEIAGTGCAGTQPPAVGAVEPNLPGSGLCTVAGSSGAEFVLIPFFSDTGAHRTSVTVSPTGTQVATSALNIVPINAGRPTIDRSLAETFEWNLRSRERQLMRRFGAMARAWRANPARGSLTPSFNAIPSAPVVGQLLTLNVNADSDCTAPVYHAARVVAVTNTAIVVADTLNPTGGFTDAEYQSFGVTFDTLIDPLDEQNFGAPSDIDHNGRVLILFTKAVNDLTPAGSSSYIGGFFYARDLFPVQATSTLQACPASNVGEMFYVMVPDPSRGAIFSKSNVTNVALGTLAHEYQHLINASRRLYVNASASDFEQVWLNEGLSHIAEELLFYRMSGLSPREDLNADSVRATTARVNAFNNYAEANVLRYDQELLKPTAYGPYSPNDSLATRGATWSFLRYAADHRSTSDGTVWYQLVNSTTTGMPNLMNVFGSGVVDEIRDWHTSVLADNQTGVAATYQQPSWNMRSILAVLVNGPFPLSTVALTTTQTITLVSGSSAYLRFAVPANGSAQISWSGAPSSMEMTLVRTR